MKKTKNIIFVSLSSIFWIAVWYVSALIINKPIILPTPLSVAKQLLEYVTQSDFWMILGTSVGNVFFGVIFGLALGIIFSVLTVNSTFFKNLFSPILTLIKVTPIASFILLLVLWMKRETIPSFISILIVLPIVWSNIVSGIESADKNLLAVAKVYKLPFFKKIRYLYLPTVMPYIFSAFRSSLGLAWKAGISAEILTSPMNSIGREMQSANMYLENTQLFAWTAVVIILSLLMEKLFVFLLDTFANKFISRRKWVCLK